MLHEIQNFKDLPRSWRKSLRANALKWATRRMRISLERIWASGTAGKSSGSRLSMPPATTEEEQVGSLTGGSWHASEGGTRHG